MIAKQKASCPVAGGREFADADNHCDGQLATGWHLNGVQARFKFMHDPGGMLAALQLSDCRVHNQQKMTMGKERNKSCSALCMDGRGGPRLAGCLA